MKRRALAVGISLVLFLSAMVGPASGEEGAPGRRMAYGKERAAQLEAITEKLVPGSQVEWDQRLKIRTASGVATPLDVIGFLTSRQSDGSSYGVLAFELGAEKEEAIAKLEKLKPVEKSALPTTLAVARFDASGRVTSLSKVEVNTGEPLTKVASIDVLEWQEGGWPVVRLRYRSYLAGVDSLTTVEWDGLFDTQKGVFLARIPSGLIVAKKSGEKTGEIFAVRRTSANEIEILGLATKKAVRYSCPDFCVVDSSALKEWAGQ